MPEEPRNNEPMKNYVYEYMHVNHVVDPLTVGSEEEWRESIRENHRQIAAGNKPKSGRKDSMGDLRADYAEFRKMASEALDDASSAAKAENEVLRAEMAELKEMVAQLAANQPPQPIPFTPQVVKPGSGEAPKEGRLPDRADGLAHLYHVVEADGVGWFDVIGPDGKAITEKSMRKSKAEKLAHERNTA